jgi:hypothetical protein
MYSGRDTPDTATRISIEHDFGEPKPSHNQGSVVIDHLLLITHGIIFLI